MEVRIGFWSSLFRETSALFVYVRIPGSGNVVKITPLPGQVLRDRVEGLRKYGLFGLLFCMFRLQTLFRDKMEPAKYKRRCYDES